MTFSLPSTLSLRKFPNDSLLTLVQAFIISKLDYCNSLLTGLPKYLVKRFQGVENAGARLVSGSKKYEHISPVLHQLHWLPVEKKNHFKNSSGLQVSPTQRSNIFM